MRFWLLLLGSILVCFAGFFFFGLTQHSGISSPKQEEVVTILMYHKVSPDPHTGGLGLRVPPEKFDWQMGYLREQGYTVVSMDEVVDFLSRRRPLPPKPVAITFDDGYRDNYLYAWPVLQKYGFCATIYLVVDAVGGYNFFDADCGRQPRNRMLDWGEIREMAATGRITFGAHTLDHPFLTEVSPDAARYQIVAAKGLLEQKLGRRVDHFCYPYGDFNPQVTAMVAAAGYRSAVTCLQGVNRPGDNLFLLRRIRVSGKCSNRRFAAELMRYRATAPEQEKI